ncbi:MULTISPECIES: c-type cytochrome [unclassified Polaromonas]|uniref:SorB family sulfite dehydrogenase c-type cytochrome subunit n=1 Tax=unclassified Polaromonas TaxID=2638319 RepID=UPI000F074497|nr:MULTISPECIES: c-type cytochrome [unclassified Polaromonas]AYQ30212.1 cytochrome C552 [Polaromonas sp. SP1]QGJ18672.1 cytochrome C552 [Polaromonas sp. Pch-P]
MNLLNLNAARVLSAAVLALGCSTAWAQAVQTVTLPLENAKLKPSKLAGYQIAMQKCGICHSADYISQQPPAMTATQWTAEVRKMEHAYAAPLSDSDVAQIGEYLAVTYGGAKPTLGPVVAAKPAPAAPGAPAAEVDVQAVLKANACLGCHAVSQKIVGPAYHDVAVKYKNDPQALAKLETSIKAGGSGKWGPVVMPPFGNLSPQELKALAGFVLKQ